MKRPGAAEPSSRLELTPSLLCALRADVATARATYGVAELEDSIRAYARRLGMGAAELSAAIGAWPVCAD